MNKKYIIQKNEEIKDIISKKNKLVTRIFITYSASNNYGYNRYCISISKKIGKAVTRNLYKRRIKNILSKNNFKNSHDYVIIVRNSIKELKFSEIEKEFIKYFKENEQ